MTSENVLDLHNRFQENGIVVWIDGGWGVDAPPDKQTPEHENLDIAVHCNISAENQKGVIC